MSTVDNVIGDRARKLLNDTSDTTWDDADLILWYNDAVITIMALRPDVRINDENQEVEFAAATAVGDTRILDDRWMPAETDYVVSRAFEMDAGDERDAARADHHWDNFSRYITIL